MLRSMALKSTNYACFCMHAMLMKNVLVAYLFTDKEIKISLKNTKDCLCSHLLFLPSKICSWFKKPSSTGNWDILLFAMSSFCREANEPIAEGRKTRLHRLRLYYLQKNQYIICKKVMTAIIMFINIRF